MRKSLICFCEKAIECVAASQLAKAQAAESSSLLTKPGGNNLAIPDDQPQPLQYSLLGTKLGEPLRNVKLKYLLAARKHHPEVGGDPENFLRASLAYQDVLKDYGMESVRGEVVNLGNFQACTHEARNYLEARARIKEYIPLSTLDEHIRQLEEAQSKVSVEMEKKLTGNNTESMWLLEDIDEITEKNKTGSVTLELTDNGEVSVSKDQNPAIEASRPLPQIPEKCDSKPTPPEATHESKTNETKKAKEPPKGTSAGPSTDTRGTGAQGSAQGEPGPDDKAVVERVTITKADIQALNAKHMVQQRDDIAGIAARTATEVMKNTVEAQQIREEASLAVYLLLLVGIFVYVGIEAYYRAKRVERIAPAQKEHIITETMLPWWGNDIEYERQVKRIFVEEWRRARSSARRESTFHEGLTRENMPQMEREKLDLAIFAVTADRVRQLKAHADAQPGRG